MLKRYRVEFGSGFHLKDYDPNDAGPFKSRKEAEEATQADILKMRVLNEEFFVDGRRALLVVLQAMDTGGKDGTIKHVFSGLNPAGCQVTSFKKPSEEEMRHHFLWRINRALPPKGMIGIFNRSHYEDVLVARVHDLVPKDVWTERYEHINAFEKVLADEGTVIVKFFLHINKAEQKKRLQARLSDRAKLWKFDVGDLTDRGLWKSYVHAYEDAIRRCSAPHAPWYIVPANNKTFRNYIVASALVKTLSELKFKLPKPKFDPQKIHIV